MKSSVGLLLVVIALTAGVFYLRWRNPVGFTRLQTDFVALFSAPAGNDTSTSTGPSPLLAKIARPATSAIAHRINVVTNIEAPTTHASAPSTPSPPAHLSSPPSSPAPIIASPSTPTTAQPSGSNDSSTAAATATQSSAPAAPTPAAVWTPPTPIPSKPDWTWTTTDGHTYKNVKILSVDPENVMILHEDGGARVPISTLNPDLQKLLNYDPKFAANWAVGRLVSGNLVALKNGSMQPVEDSVIRPVKYFAIYYSAGWCPYCHQFTPDFVKFYNDFKPSHSDFEVIFISEDHDPTSMLAHMKEMSMPWLAIDYGALVHQSGTNTGPGIQSFAHGGIPDLVLLDATGKVLSDSMQDGTYVGPKPVVADIKKMVQ